MLTFRLKNLAAVALKRRFICFHNHICHLESPWSHLGVAVDALAWTDQDVSDARDEVTLERNAVTAVVVVVG